LTKIYYSKDRKKLLESSMSDVKMGDINL